jgi:hypothetical protein
MQTTIQHLFQVTALEDIPRERLESFVEEYPFFGYGHYLLSRKLRAENSDEYTGMTAKASLYFSNPFWLEWLLVNAPETKTKRETTDTAATPGNSEVEASMPEQEEKDIWSSPEMPVELEAPKAEHPTSPTAEVGETEHAAIEAEDTTPTVMDIQATELSDIEVQHTALPVPAETIPSSVAQQLLNNIEEARLLRESLLKINEDFHTHILPADEPIRDEEPPFVLEEQEQVTPPVEEVSISEETITPAEESPVPETPEAPQEQPPAAEHLPSIGHHHQDTPAPAEEPAAIPVAETSAAQAPLAEAPDPTPAAAPAMTGEPVLTFEPYHTIDYFASQGIRLTPDENPSDQLGKQLKSFTEWLRVMRRLPQKEKELIPDRVVEQEIQSIAAHSIEGKEVLTETMAEVLAKQGMPERARIVYEKLSLQNPGKSAYFAAKIEQLNSH